MSKFIKYLNENSPLDLLNLNQFKKDCLLYLKQLKKDNFKFLYSGRKKTDPIFKQKVRKDRKPLDTPEAIHNLIDNEFFYQFKIKARSQSLFALLDWSRTGFYGNTYYVFPVGNNYSFIYSNNITDLFVKINDALRAETQLSMGLWREFEFASKDDVLYWSTLNNRYFRGNKDKINNNVKTVTREEFLLIIKSVVSKLIRKNYIESKSLSDIPSNFKNEIMVVCNETWMIDRSLVSIDHMKSWIKDNI